MHQSRARRWPKPATELGDGNRVADVDVALEPTSERVLLVQPANVGVSSDLTWDVVQLFVPGTTVLSSAMRTFSAFPWLVTWVAAEEVCRDHGQVRTS